VISKQLSVLGERSTDNGEQIPLPGLYVHVPFCKTKCPYCDFYSVTNLSIVSGWVEAVIKEIRFYKDQFPSFDSLYLGGGTPTLMAAPQLTRLLEGIFLSVTLCSGSEVTVEVNPDDVTAEELQHLQHLGVNRISIGVQSFHDDELHFLQRRHTALQSERALDLIRTAGFTNLSIDLMYALEGQTEAAWVETLEKAVSFSPEHISCYQLTIEPNTPFGERVRQNTLMQMGDEKQRSFFLLTSEFLESHGYLHYEVSSFAQSDALMCRHNRKYWNHTPYLGLGPAAHSFNGHQRWWNVKSVSRYCELIHQGTPPVSETEKLSSEQRLLESLFLGFRTSDGVNLSLVADRPQTQSILEDLQRSQLIRIENGRAIPTRQGFLVADSLPLLFSDR
jgi:oxygen-independent coproporphyrinogen-3 oxidase